MSVIGSNILAGASGQGGGYNLTRSLRFRSSASAELSRSFTTPTGTSWTFSAWVKLGTLGQEKPLLYSASGTVREYIVINSDGTLEWKRMDYTDDTYFQKRITTAVYRDPSAWYHIVVRFSSSSPSFQVNGVTATSTYTSGFATAQRINTAITHTIGTSATGNADMYMTEVNFIDGQSLTASNFGETSSKTGVWQPKRYAGTYGTNGFYLPFTDNSALTTSSNVGLGKDFSGNGNYWTTNNISVTAGATYDSMTDVPTLTSATASNFAVLNPLSISTSALRWGNLRWTGASGLPKSTIEFPKSGKFYCEMTATTTDGSNLVFGLIDSTNTYYAQIRGSSNDFQQNIGTLTLNSYSDFSNGDVAGLAFDITNATLNVYKNNTLVATVTGVSTSYDYFIRAGSLATTDVLDYNFGQRPFAYTPPTGFVALNTYNLPTPTIGATASTQAEKYMDISLYSGTSASGNNITDGLSLSSGGLLWVKNRNATGNHALVDSVRGITKRISSDNTNAEDTVSAITSFNSNGFTLEGSDGSFNLSGRTYVAWQWLANGSGSTNTAGSITSTVSANTTSGFSVVTYTGTGAAATVGHGLGVAPKMIILKRRNGTSNWTVGHSSLPSWAYYLVLNITDAQGSNNVVWNSTAPTSTVFTVGTGADQNGSGNTIVAYCFSEVAGYSKFGSYTGNGSSDGPFVYTGFRPRYIMFKGTTLASSWLIYDTARSAINPVPVTGGFLLANSSAAEAGTGDSAAYVDILSNGFKIRNNSGFDNNSGSDTYIYMAFASNPFKYSLGA